MVEEILLLLWFYRLYRLMNDDRLYNFIAIFCKCLINYFGVFVCLVLFSTLKNLMICKITASNR